MPVRACRVTVHDTDGVSHTVEVSAETLYEAVALGIAAIRTDEWVAGIATGLNTVKAPPLKSVKDGAPAKPGIVTLYLSS
jgi:hypothetical protein